MVKDLTSGKPSKVIYGYTIPMFLSVIFQQLYNIADSVIAGRFAGEDALAAVGASYPVTMIFNAIAIGCNIGSSVVIARIFGSRDYLHMRTAISTTVISAVIASVGLTVFGFAMCNPVMRLLNTPENIFADSALYLKIYIGGFAFLFLYNIATAIFVSVGDSKTPLFFLICSSVANIVLDYVFVKYFHLGVAGVAWATFAAQGAACILALISVSKRIKEIKVYEKYKKFSWSTLHEISAVAIPSILQQSFVSVGNLFIQRLINGFGSSVVAGYSAAIKLNTFCITSITTLGNGVSGFTAQNVGANKPQRIDKGFAASLIMSLFITIPFSVVYFFGCEPLILLFLEGNNAEALEIGKVFLKICSPFYCPIAFKILADGVLRGTNRMKVFMVTTFADLILRVIFAYILSPYMGTDGIWIAWPIGWLTCTVMSVIFYLQGYKQRRKHTSAI